MPDETRDETTAQPQAPELDPTRLHHLMERLRGEQNLNLGILGGAAAALVGAALWAGITVATGYQIGWMAVGVGFLVGFAVRAAGKGIDKAFGVVGAAWALLGCGAGNLLAVCAMVARQESLPFFEIVSRLDFTIARELMVATFSPMDLLFYGLAVYEGYKFSFRQLSQEELAAMLPG